MTPDRLYNRLHDLHHDLTAIQDNPKTIAANWPIITGDMAELARAVKTTVPEEAYRFFWLFCIHTCQTLEGGIAALQLACNSDDDTETNNVLTLVDSALSGLAHTLQRCFIFDQETEVTCD